LKRKTLGLALGAGSTKGFAHIGVLQVLQEQEIPIDAIAGCSMGAIIGSIFAVGGDMYMLEKYIATLNIRHYLDIANPFNGGLLRGKRLQDQVRTLTHDKDFSETNIPFLCTAVNAENCNLEILSSGKLHESVRASMSMPGFFQPHSLHGNLYIDGAVIERVPVNALKERGLDVVIGVDVGFRGEDEDIVSMNAYQLAGHTINIMQWNMAKQSQIHADVMIVPDVRQYVHGRFQMDMIDRSVKSGRQATEDALPQIRELLSKKSVWRSLRGLWDR